MKKIQLRITELDAGIWAMVYVFFPMFSFAALFVKQKLPLGVWPTLVFIGGPIMILILSLFVWSLIIREMKDTEYLFLEAKRVAEGGMMCLSSSVVGFVGVGALKESYSTASFIVFLLCMFFFKEGIRLYYAARPLLEVRVSEFEYETFEEIRERIKKEREEKEEQKKKEE